MIALNHVTKRYGRLTAVKDVTLQVPEKRILGLLGQNGAGKTTLLNLMTGYFPPSEGEVTIDGLSMLKSPCECKRMIGYLPEKPPLYDEMTVEEYLTFVCRLREVRRGAIAAHIRGIAERCGLTEVWHARIASLSKGYRQRVGMAEALCGDPPMLILDEPTVGLDPRQVVEMRELIRELGREHTVIFSSHLLAEVQHLCDRAVILNRGVVVHEADMNAEVNSAATVLEADILGASARLIPALRTIPDVRKVICTAERNGVSHIRLTACRDAAHPYAAAEKLFRTLSALDCPLLSLTRSHDTLEEIFLRVTAEDPDGEEEAS